MADTIVLILRNDLEGDIAKAEKKYDPISLVPVSGFVLGEGNSYPLFWAFKIKNKSLKDLAYLMKPMLDGPGTIIYTPIVLIKHEYYLPYEDIFTAEQLQAVIDSETWDFLEVTEDQFLNKEEP